MCIAHGVRCDDTQEFWRVENKDSGGRLRGAVRRVDAKRQKMDRTGYGAAKVRREQRAVLER
jgi:hypothetical protein